MEEVRQSVVSRLVCQILRQMNATRAGNAVLALYRITWEGLESSADGNSAGSFLAGCPTQVGPYLEQLSQTVNQALHAR